MARLTNLEMVVDILNDLDSDTALGGTAFSSEHYLEIKSITHTVNGSGTVSVYFANDDTKKVEFEREVQKYLNS